MDLRNSTFLKWELWWEVTPPTEETPTPLITNYLIQTSNVQIQRDPRNYSSDPRIHSSDHRNQTRYNFGSMKKQAAIIVIYRTNCKKGAKYWSLLKQDGSNTQQHLSVNVTSQRNFSLIQWHISKKPNATTLICYLVNINKTLMMLYVIGNYLPRVSIHSLTIMSLNWNKHNQKISLSGVSW